MAEQNSGKYKTSPAMRKAIKKYQHEKVENIQVRVPKGEKQKYVDAAAAAGESLNQFAVSAMDERITRLNKKNK